MLFTSSCFRRVTFAGILLIAAVWGYFALTGSAPAWEQSDSEISESINRVTAGKSLKPAQWPNGAKVAVAFSLDVDNQSAVLSSAGSLYDFLSGGATPAVMSMAEYGARKGIQRLTNIFDKYHVPATYFMPAISLKAAPEMADVIKRSGVHEVALHGWVHEEAAYISTEETLDLLTRASEYLESVFGVTPVGFRAPMTIGEHTFPALQKLGLLYDSSLASDDVPFEVNLFGEPSGLVELPVSLALEDSQLDPLFNLFTNGHSPAEVLHIFKDEFDVAYDEGGMVLFVLHPHITGMRSRAAIIERLIQYMQLKPDVWFATHREIAEYVKGQSSVSPRE